MKQSVSVTLCPKTERNTGCIGVCFKKRSPSNKQQFRILGELLKGMPHDLDVIQRLFRKNSDNYLVYILLDLNTSVIESFDLMKKFAEAIEASQMVCEVNIDPRPHHRAA